MKTTTQETRAIVRKLMHQTGRSLTAAAKKSQDHHIPELLQMCGAWLKHATDLWTTTNEGAERTGTAPRETQPQTQPQRSTPHGVFETSDPATTPEQQTTDQEDPCST